MKKVVIFVTISVSVVLASCGPSGLSNQDGGTLIGAVAGGLIGSQIGGGAGRVVATVAGVVIGGIAGNEIGKRLDDADRRAAAEAEYNALEYGRSGVASPWRNPDTGHYGTVVAGKPFKRERNFCREYTHTIYIEGRPESVKGVACRDDDGTWRIVP